MADNRFSRTELILGAAAMARLKAASVAVFGVGGVGGYAVEALSRSGVGRLDLFDNDKVCLSNLNRQIHATAAMLGRYKVDAAKERILDINPDAAVGAHRLFYLPETSGQVDLSQYDYVIDAIDTVSGKIELAVKASQLGVPIISSMGAGNKLDPTRFEVADLFDTSICPLARVMRRELRRRGVHNLKVVYSKEPPTPLCAHGADEPACPGGGGDEALSARKKHPPGSTAFVPAAVGLIIAAEVVRDLAGV